MASTASPRSGPERVHLPAPACMFWKGLPLPFAGLCVCRGPAVGVEDGRDVGVALEVSAGLDDAAAVGVTMAEVAFPCTVDVMMVPVLMPVGPITMGTTTCSVFPLLSVVVCVIVVLIVLVKAWATSLPLVVLCSLGLDDAAVGVVCTGASVAVA